MKIHVVGTSGSGKSTLARQIATELNIPYIELDELHWGPQWSSRATFVADTIKAFDSAPSWIVCGNYSKVADEILKRIDTVIWLDYPIYVPLYRITLRSFKRALWREKLWSGNRETLSEFLFSKRSMLRWVLTTHAKRKETYTQLLKDPSLSHLKWIIVEKPQSLKALMADIRPKLQS